MLIHSMACWGFPIKELVPSCQEASLRAVSASLQQEAEAKYRPGPGQLASQAIPEMGGPGVITSPSICMCI